ncbi:MAG: VanZ family protein [Terrimicrobiaceae bacterium]
MLLVLWAGSLWALSSMPGDAVELPSISYADKVAHFVYFFVGGFLWAAFLSRLIPWRGVKLIACTGALIALIGAVDEVHQLWTPNRSGCDVGDWLADSAGGVTGAFVFVCLHALAGKRRPEEADKLAPPGN